MRILLIDDKRNYIIDETILHIARNYKDGIFMLQCSPKWDILLLDHDLGDFDQTGKEYTGYDILCWLEQNKQYLPRNIKLVTNNPSARERMQLVINTLY